MSDPAPAVTVEMLRRSAWRRVSNVDLAQGGSIVGYVSIQHPRMSREVYRGTRYAKPRTTILVDGARCRDLADAAEALSGPVLPEDLYERLAS